MKKLIPTILLLLCSICTAGQWTAEPPVFEETGDGYGPHNYHAAYLTGTNKFHVVAETTTFDPDSRGYAWAQGTLKYEWNYTGGISPLTALWFDVSTEHESISLGGTWVSDGGSSGYASGSTTGSFAVWYGTKNIQSYTHATGSDSTSGSGSADAYKYENSGYWDSVEEIENENEYSWYAEMEGNFEGYEQLVWIPAGANHIEITFTGYCSSTTNASIYSGEPHLLSDGESELDVTCYIGLK